MQDPRALTLPIYPASARLEVDPAIKQVQFACDISVCKGACCTMPAAAGAPILKSEIAELERVFPIVEKYLQKKALPVIEKKGLWECDADGNYSIPAIRGRDCIFAIWEGDIALCAIEKAHRLGEIEGFPKPISCHLFPIRIYPNYTEGSYSIVYEEIPECHGGRDRGKTAKIPVVDFLELPLARALGEERLLRLRKAIAAE